MTADNFEEIKFGDKLYAILIRADFSSDKTLFFSEPHFSQQLGYISYKKDHVIKAHFHRESHRDIIYTQEVIFVRKGRLTVNFYAEDKKHAGSRELTAGDVIFLCGGGHGFKLHEDTEMIEVKQGPYSGRESDKEIFEGVEK